VYLLVNTIQCLDWFGGRNISAARCDNSGENGVNEGNLDDSNGATPGYPREIGERLTGVKINWMVG